MNTRFFFIVAAWTLAVLLSVAVILSVAAQSDPAFAGADLEPTPTVSEALGLSMHMPRGAEVTTTYVGRSATITVVEQGASPLWQMRIQAMAIPSLENPSPTGLAEELMKQLRRGGQVTNIKVNEQRTLAGRAAHLMYVEGSNELLGFLIVERDPGRFVVVRISGYAQDYDRIRAALEPSLNTVMVSSVDEVVRERQQQASLALTALDSFSPERLRSLVGMSQWYRIYKPDARGSLIRDREIGYYRVDVREGKRGELNVNRDIDAYAAGEQEDGLILAIDARYLENVERGVVADVQIRFWLSWDRSEESWQARVTRRQGEAAITEAEVGVRTPPSLGIQKLKVVKNTVETRERDEFDWEVKQPYFSQIEVYLLGSLLPRDGSVSGAMAGQYYESSTTNTVELPTRIDSWMPASDGSGNWILESQLMPDLPPVISIFDRAGMLVRRSKSDGSVTEPIELMRLREIWQQKGLPTGSGSGLDAPAPPVTPRPAQPRQPRQPQPDRVDR
ncbi:MAG: hypothetical protein ACR2GY_13480 [Phycisphaerales bacterium]